MPSKQSIRLQRRTIRFGSLLVKEHYGTDENRPYRVAMEAEVSTKEEAQARHHEALELANDLNCVWAYVAGEPLFAKRLVLQVASAPDGWQTNFAETEAALPSSQRFHGTAKFSSRFSMTMPYLPLQNALAAVRSYRAANAECKVLMSLHFDAMDHPGSQAGLFLYAKALELARAMLPGRTDPKRQAALSADVRSELRQSLHWLYDVANNRLEIRHVVSTGSLLPKLTSIERRDFLHDADLVIRGVVERELGVRAAIVKTK